MNRFITIIFFFGIQFSIAQQSQYVDFKTAKANLVFGDIKKHEVGGTITYEFQILKDIDSIFVDAINMTFENVSLSNETISYSNDGKKLWLKYEFKKDSLYQLSFNYKASPKKSIYFIDWGIENGNRQIWTQGQGKYTSNWLPSFDDMNEKVEFDLNITFDKNYDVIANGKLTNKQINDSTIAWHYDMQHPMSSYLVALAIGKYDKKVTYSSSGIPLEMYYYPEDSLKFEPTYRYTKQIFDFLEIEIGVPYPWQNYKQVPVKDFLYAGMENTTTTIFSDAFVVDSIAFVDKNYVNVNAHELAHQWFGDLVTETSGTHHWLQEGFATYYALLAERSVFGNDYYYWRLFEYAQELLEQDKAGQSTSLLNPKSSSTTFYKKGTLVLHMLREKVGDKPFKKAIQNYLQKHQFKNVETEDFINEVEKTSGRDLKSFITLWLESDVLNFDGIIENLELNSTSIKQYLQYDCKETPEICKLFLLNQNDSFYKERIVESLKNNISKSTFLTDDIKTRQAIAKSLVAVPSNLKQDYETLLDDKSYLTMEIALYNLWKNFPESRKEYLGKTKGVYGFNDKNVRMLWLALTLNTPEFEFGNNDVYFEELRNYTKPRYDFNIRQNAFQYLSAMQACDSICKANLREATQHHNWRFYKFAKSMLSEISETKE